MTYRYAFYALLSAALCFPPRPSIAASPDTLIDSRTVLLEGIRLNDAGKYKEAIALFRTVPAGDTNYSIAVSEIGVSSLSDSAWADARAAAIEGLSLPYSPDRRNFLLLLANANDYLGKHKEAYDTYDTLLAINPYDHQPWYERGTSYSLQKDYDRAIAQFRQAIMLNPAHYRSHLNLGVALLELGRLSEAYLALSFSFFMTSDRGLAQHCMKLLNGIQTGEDEAIAAYKSRRPGVADPAFEEADAIVSAKLALSKDYKYESAMAGDITANTLHAILEKLTYDPADTGLVMQYYVPFYKAAYDGGKFDELLLLMYSRFGIEAIDRQAKKRERSVEELRQELQAYTAKIAATQVLPYAQRKTAPERFGILPGGGLFIVGGLQSSDPLKFMPGPVTYYKAGVLGGRGTADAGGEKVGDWTFYYDNGAVRSREHYRSGKQTGEAFYYRKNGTLAKSYRFDDEGKAKEMREYAYNGTLSGLTTEHGEYADYSAYLPNGAVAYKVKLVKGKIQDAVMKISRADGSLAEEAQLDGGEREGATREFYANGKPSGEYNYRRGKRDGPAKEYHENGQLHFTMTYEGGKLDGPYAEYDEDGKVTERGMYASGKKTGTLEYLTPEGRVYGTVNYRKDRPVAYRYTDDGGKELSAGDKASDEGLNLLVAYHPNGEKMTELPLSNGIAQGEAKYYYATGGISRRIAYEEDERAGREIRYYLSGAVQSESYYQNGAVRGRYVYYTDAGAKRSEGYLDGSTRVGSWRFFYPDGKPEVESFYISGTLTGPERNYYANGRLRYIRTFDHDMLIGVAEYDTTGKEVRRAAFPGGNGTFELHFPDGSVRYKVGLKSGNFDGPYFSYSPNGSVAEEGKYNNDLSEGLVTGHHPNGTQSLSGNMKAGKRDGVWIWYDAAGNPEHEITYNHGEQEGAEKLYEGGILHTTYTYHNNERDGREILYGDSGRIAAVYVFKEGIITGYTHPDKEGKELPVIPMKGGSGHIVTYYPNGQKSTDYIYRGGVAEGDGGRWYSNGKRAMEVHYDKGAITEGFLRRWAPNGQMIYECDYHKDVRRGTERCWNASGALISSAEYADNGERHGAATYNNPATGKKVSVRYYYGTIIGITP